MTVNVFDIATDTWFTQLSTAHEKFPTQRATFCSVVASAEDSSSHNIYIYGGRSDTYGGPPMMSDIFILTLPAFHWVSVYPLVNDTCPDNTCELHEIFEHKCQKAHEKYMVAYGGLNLQYRCTNSALNIFQGMTIYDMSSLTWTTKIELENQKYLVPEVLYRIIGGK